MGVFAKLDGIKTTPQVVIWDAITGKQAPQGDFALGELEPLSLVQKDGQIFYKGPDGVLLGPLGGEGVFSSHSLDDKGSVIVGDNHFRTGEGGDPLIGSGRSIDIWTNGGASTFEPVQSVEVRTLMMHQGAMNSPQLRDLAGNTSEIFTPAAGMDGFGESPNPALELGGTSGSGDTSFLMGIISETKSNSQQFELPH